MTSSSIVERRVGLNIRTDVISVIGQESGLGAVIVSGSEGMFVDPDSTSLGSTGLIIGGSLTLRDCCNDAFQGSVITGYNGMSVGSVAFKAQTAPAKQVRSSMITETSFLLER